MAEQTLKGMGLDFPTSSYERYGIKINSVVYLLIAWIIIGLLLLGIHLAVYGLVKLVPSPKPWVGALHEWLKHGLCANAFLRFFMLIYSDLMLICCLDIRYLFSSDASTAFRYISLGICILLLLYCLGFPLMSIGLWAPPTPDSTELVWRLGDQRPQRMVGFLAFCATKMAMVLVLILDQHQGVQIALLGLVSVTSLVGSMAYNVWESRFTYFVNAIMEVAITLTTSLVFVQQYATAKAWVSYIIVSIIILALLITFGISWAETLFKAWPH